MTRILFVLWFCVQSATSHAGLSILQGLTDAQSTQISIVLPKNTPHLRYELLLGQRVLSPTQVSRAERTHSDWAADQVSFEGLKLGVTYQLRVWSGSVLLDHRELRALDTTERQVSIALLSCMADFMPSHTRMWASVIAAQPEVLFFLGDNVYASLLTPVSAEKIWDRYVETRQRLEIYQAASLIPSVAIWDDHDFGWNNGDSTFAHRDESQAIFRAFFAQQERPGTLERGPGVSSLYQAFGQDFYFMDDRSFRVRGEATGTLWGEEQSNWLREHLDWSARPSWILNGTQFFGKYGRSESFEGDFPGLFTQWRSEWANTWGPLVFVSGDIHYSEIQKVTLGGDLKTGAPPRVTYEITSSSLHSFRRPLTSIPTNPRRVAGVYEDNFILVRSYKEEDRLKVHATSYGPEGKVYFENDLEVGSSQP